MMIVNLYSSVCLFISFVFLAVIFFSKNRNNENRFKSPRDICNTDLESSHTNIESKIMRSSVIVDCTLYTYSAAYVFCVDCRMRVKY